jgi:hypothetical protein
MKARWDGAIKDAEGQLARVNRRLQTCYRGFQSAAGEWASVARRRLSFANGASSAFNPARNAGSTTNGYRFSAPRHRRTSRSLRPRNSYALWFPLLSAAYLDISSQFALLLYSLNLTVCFATPTATTTNPSVTFLNGLVVYSLPVSNHSIDFSNS